MHVIFFVKSEKNSRCFVEFGFSCSRPFPNDYLLIKQQINLKELRNEGVDRIHIPIEC
jgi:hypothetical protein